jgi:hypothetical protein
MRVERRHLRLLKTRIYLAAEEFFVEYLNEIRVNI